MASLSSRVRTFSTASRGLLKLKRHPYSHKLAVSSHQRFHMISRCPKDVPSPAFLGSSRFLSTMATPTGTPQYDSNHNNSEDEESDSETEPVESLVYDIPYLKSGDKTFFELSMNERALRLRMDMPGVDKKGAKTWVEDNSLRVRGVEAEAHAGVEKREYEYEYELTEADARLLKLKEANAEMKNGVLRVFIPKVNLEDRKKSTINIPIK